MAPKKKKVVGLINSKIEDAAAANLENLRRGA